MDRITKVIYINCWHRTDRKEQMEEELKNKFKYDKAERLDATVLKEGPRAATISHVRIMQRMIVEDWDTVMIMEDDASLRVSREELDGYINAFLDDEPADILCIANSCAKKEEYNTSDLYIKAINRTNGDAHHADENCGCKNGGACNGIPFYSPRFLRALNTHNAACYIVKKQVIKPLLKCLVNTIELDYPLNVSKLIDSGLGIIDSSWNDIIGKHIFLIPNVPPYARLVVQRASYSDVERRFTDHAI
jgi:hypothetical protein